MVGLTPGRIVHYVLDNGEHRAAIVTKVQDTEKGVVHLTVFTLHSDTVQTNMPGHNEGKAYNVPYAEATEKIVDTWHWIEQA